MKLLHHLGVFSSEALVRMVSMEQRPGTASDRYHFWSGSWWRADRRGLAIVGCIPTCSQRSSINSLGLPRTGDVVYQGFPPSPFHGKELRSQSAPSQLASLDCRATTVSGWPEVAQSLWNRDTTILVLDAASLGEQGPAIAMSIRSMAPETRVVILPLRLGAMNRSTAAAACSTMR